MASSTTPTDGRPRAAVLGGGPIGLAAALALVDTGWTVRLHEAGPTVGTHVRAWGHVRLFTPWSMAASPRMRGHLEPAGHDLPDLADGRHAYPTGHELVDRVLLPLADVPALDGVVRTSSTVVGVARRGLVKHEAIGGDDRARRPFRLLVADADGEHDEDADLVVDATGTYGQPNALGDGGVPATGERALDARILRRLPEVQGAYDRWGMRRVLLVGAGKSAQTAARDLDRDVAELTWVVRSPDPDWGAVADDSLPGRAALVDSSERLRHGRSSATAVRTGTTVTALRPAGDAVVATLSDGDELTVDDVVALTGYVGDAGLYRQLQVHECYATAAPMALSATLLAAAGDGPADCLAQPAVGVDALRSPEPGFFVLGAKSYGRNSAFLLRVGYEQVETVAASVSRAEDAAALSPGVSNASSLTALSP